MKQCEQLDHKAQISLAKSNFGPNNNQMAVAIAAFMLKSKSKKQIWLAPPGMGKSRMIAATIWLFAQQPKVDKILLVFSSTVLMETDKKVFEEISMLTFDKLQTVFYEAIDRASVTDKTLIVCDEVDDLLIDKLVTLPRSQYVIGFSATAVSDLKTAESDYLSMLGYKVFDSLIPRQQDESVIEISAADFFLRESHRAKLVYCEDY